MSKTLSGEESRMKGQWMNRSILIIAPNFPPEDQVGAYRVYRLAKYLPHLGWKPYVLTVDINYRHREDYSLLENLPPEVEIHRARNIEPTTRGVRMALGGVDTTAAAMQRRGQVAATPVGGVESAALPLGRRVASGALDLIRTRWLFNPDIFATWYLPAIRKARHLIRDHDIPLVFSTQPDFTGHWIASTLQNEGVKWVADVRDPSGYLMRPSERFWDRGYYRRRELERHTVTHADAVTVASEGIGMILADMYKPGNIKRWQFIPTGIDEELLPKQASDPFCDVPYLLYPGNVFPEYGSQFMRIFAQSLRNESVRNSGVKLVIAGEFTRNAPVVAPLARELEIEDHVTLVDRLPQSKVLEALSGAVAGVLMTGREVRWWCLHAKAVEYMALRKPVIAVVPELSESRLWLEKTGLGVFLDGDISAAATTLSDFILHRDPKPEPNDSECDRFLASRQAESFASLFDQIVGDT